MEDISHLFYPVPKNDRCHAARAVGGENGKVSGILRRDEIALWSASYNSSHATQVEPGHRTSWLAGMWRTPPQMGCMEDTQFPLSITGKGLPSEKRQREDHALWSRKRLQIAPPPSERPDQRADSVCGPRSLCLKFDVLHFNSTPNGIRYLYKDISKSSILRFRVWRPNSVPGGTVAKLPRAPLIY